MSQLPPDSDLLTSLELPEKWMGEACAAAYHAGCRVAEEASSDRDDEKRRHYFNRVRSEEWLTTPHPTAYWHEVVWRYQALGLVEADIASRWKAIEPDQLADDPRVVHFMRGWEVRGIEIIENQRARGLRA